MPVQIGATAHNFSNPTGLLSDCHRRIEMFLRSLQAVASGGRQLDPERRSALGLALRYFRESAPKHTADEEESLFPRLRSLHSEQVKSALADVERLEHDHREADALHRRVDEMGTLWLHTGDLSAADLAQFREAVARLAEIYPRHIEVEDKVLFPAADSALSPQQKSEIAAEMAGRRSVKLTTL
ncbi:MAG TPA: hemerythrin domain-containing protein [Terriglobales bacterium]|nr:hemerythrin domain-containing protein [Terriglobales bacterium]